METYDKFDSPKATTETGDAAPDPLATQSTGRKEDSFCVRNKRTICIASALTAALVILSVTIAIPVSLANAPKDPTQRASEKSLPLADQSDIQLCREDKDCICEDYTDRKNCLLEKDYKYRCLGETESVEDATGFCSRAKYCESNKDCPGSETCYENPEQESYCTTAPVDEHPDKQEKVTPQPIDIFGDDFKKRVDKTVDGNNLFAMPRVRKERRIRPYHLRMEDVAREKFFYPQSKIPVRRATQNSSQIVKTLESAKQARSFKTLSNYDCTKSGELNICDQPDYRNTYKTKLDDSTIEDLKLNITFHFQYDENENLQNGITHPRILALAKAVKEQYEKVGFQIKPYAQMYRPGSISRYLHAWVGYPDQCRIGNYLLRYRVAAGNSLAFSEQTTWFIKAALKKQKIVYSTDGEIEDVVDVHVAQYMYTGDEVKVKVLSSARVSVCIVACADDKCLKYEVEACIEKPAGSFSFRYTLGSGSTTPRWSYYAVKVTGLDSGGAGEFIPEIDWTKSQSCVEPRDYMTSMVDPMKVKPFNVFVVEFPPDMTRSGYADSLTLGFGNFPWDDYANIGVLFIAADAVNPIPEDTLIHEMGHCAGLYHTFHGNDEKREMCGACHESMSMSAEQRELVGDYLSDTSPHVKQFTCKPPKGADCGGNSWDIDNKFTSENFMSYGDQCNFRITPMQGRRMKCYMDNVREGKEFF